MGFRFIVVFFSIFVSIITATRPELSTEQARVLVGGAIGLITSLATNDDAALGRAQLSATITAMALATLDTPFKELPCP